MRKRIVLSVVISFMLSVLICSQTKALKDDLAIKFKGDAKIETGGFYAGVEMHHSNPMPQRISFYYPSANSMDASVDYWKRDTTFVMECSLKIDDNKKEVIGKEPYEYSLTPFSVEFNKSGKPKNIDISYHYAKEKPAIIITYIIKNTSEKKSDYEFEINMGKALRTSHTYNTVYPVKYEAKNGALFFSYNAETQNAAMFIVNAAAQPVKSDSSVSLLYKEKVAPGKELKIVLIIGTCKEQEKYSISEYLVKNYKEEINNFEDGVLKTAYSEKVFETGDKVIDQSVHWAKALLETSKHYIDGEIMPMPCPAEYNFYFTHDVLLTDLAAVSFDLKRVKKDLLFIKSKSSADKNIPHAFYWKDDKFVTEEADNANWNHLWFVITSASYLRHSQDTATLKALYPYITKSITEILKNKRADSLMWAYRPDWWDIGTNWGPRAFMTILAAQALRDYVYIASNINESEGKLTYYQRLSNEMQIKLNEKLWNKKINYLTNYFEDGSEDLHYYIGSLLASHFNLLDDAKKTQLAETAKKVLLDPKIGIYAVYPMDFQDLKTFWKFVGNEAGDKYYYINGGVWPHSNSWYSLALIAAGEKKEAFNFIKNCMTINGIINSPNGQPAMYEYRNSNATNPTVYGQIDKPQFMWAAGWYLYSIYHLYGIADNNWNIKLNPYKPEAKNYSFNLDYNGGSILTSVTGSGKYLNKIIYDNKEYPSLILPAELKGTKAIKLALGNVENPYLSNANAALISAKYQKNKKELSIILKAFVGYTDKAEITSSAKPKSIYIDGKVLAKGYSVKKENNTYITTIELFYKNEKADIRIDY
jgi:hypothetical protein